MPTRRQLLLSTAAMGMAGVGALAGCSGDAPAELEEGDSLRMRVWSESAATAYENSLAAFTDSTGIEVDLEVLSWEDYWEQLPLDVASGDMPDVLWMNTANLAQAQASGKLLEIGEVVGEETARWESAATDLYRLESGLWGVPQVWEQSILVAHEGLVSAVEGDASALSFEAGAPSDPLRKLSHALTVDAEGRRPDEDGFDPGARRTFGFSAHPDRTAVLGPFIAAQGGSWQDEDGTVTFASEEGIAAVQYLADMVSAHLAPDGKDTAEDPTLCRTLFLQGKLGLHPPRRRRTGGAATAGALDRRARHRPAGRGPREGDRRAAALARRRRGPAPPGGEPPGDPRAPGPARGLGEELGGRRCGRDGDRGARGRRPARGR